MERLKSISQNYVTDPVGRALFMALAQLTSTEIPSQQWTTLTLDEALAKCYDLADECGWPTEPGPDLDQIKERESRQFPTT